MSEKKIIKNRVAVLDIKSALKFYKKENGKTLMTRGELAVETGISLQTRINYEKRDSKILGFILNLHESTGYPLEKIIKETTNG